MNDELKMSILNLEMMLISLTGFDYICTLERGNKINYRKDLTFLVKEELSWLDIDCLLDNNFLLPPHEVATKLFVRLYDGNFHHLEKFSQFAEIRLKAKDFIRKICYEY